MGILPLLMQSATWMPAATRSICAATGARAGTTFCCRLIQPFRGSVWLSNSMLRQHPHCPVNQLPMQLQPSCFPAPKSYDLRFTLLVSVKRLHSAERSTRCVSCGAHCGRCRRGVHFEGDVHPQSIRDGPCDYLLNGDYLGQITLGLIQKHIVVDSEDMVCAGSILLCVGRYVVVDVICQRVVEEGLPSVDDVAVIEVCGFRR